MEEILKKIKPYRTWLVAGLVVFVVLGAFLSRYYASSRGTLVDDQTQTLEKILGVKPMPVDQLKSYQSHNGIVGIQQWETENGANVYFVPVHSLPMVDIAVVFDAGSARNGKKGGLAYITNTLLTAGTSNSTADEIATKFDSLGAQLQTLSQRDMAMISLRSLSSVQQLGMAVKTLGEVISDAKFPEEGFKREQQNMLVSLKQQDQLPQYVASKALYSLLYSGQPYGNLILGDERSVNKLSVKDVQEFYKKYYCAKNATIVIVGNVNLESADVIARTLTANLEVGHRAQEIPEVQDLSQTTTKQIDFPSEQTHILIGEIGIRRQDPDYYSLMVGNHILGGNPLVSRIFDTVRNKNGLAYSAYSYFLPMSERGPFIVGCQTRNDKALDAQKMLLTTLKEFIAKGPTEEELEAAKKNLLGGYALQFSSNSEIRDQVAALGFYKLNIDYFDQFKTQVEKLTSKDIKKAFQRRLSPEKMVIVSVGGKPEDVKSKEEILPQDTNRMHDIRE